MTVVANDQCDMLFESCDEAVLIAAAEDDAPAEGGVMETGILGLKNTDRLNVQPLLRMSMQT